MTDFSDAKEYLAHFGVKGMKWGVRRDRSPVPITTSHVPGKKVSAKGGKYQPASEDAVRARELKQKARKSTTDALSNKELQDVVNRMNLEQQYNRLDQTKSARGKNFIKKMIKNDAGNVVITGVDTHPKFKDTGKLDNAVHVAKTVNSLAKLMAGNK